MNLLEYVKEAITMLTEKEVKYFHIMNAKSGVLYITAEPGVAKSAIARSIAKKLNFRYFDIRLSMLDETDTGLFPTLLEKEVTDEDGQQRVVKVLSHVVPEWAYEANQKPSIIHFEELNRAPLAVRNAALQILLERSIGVHFKFNDNVLMMASGNLGEADGTDVEEFDMALNNRLIHVSHSLNIEEWIEGFAKDNVHPVIVNFLKANPEHFIKRSDDEHHKAYATPRSWTFLSDYITSKYGKNASIKDFISDVRALGTSYIGPSNQRFVRFLDESMKFGIQDLLDRYDSIKKDLETFNRDKKSELLSQLKELQVSKMKDHQIENVKKFILTISEDEAIAYLLKVLDDEYQMNDDSEDNKAAEIFLKDKRFKHFHAAILKHCEDSDEE
jgi:hypothetical protein